MNHLRRAFLRDFAAAVIACGRRDARMAGELLCTLPHAQTQAACEALRAEFTPRYRKVAPKAVERLVTFYQFPCEHWPHLRTTNIVESPFATVRLRATAAKRFKKVENAMALIWEYLQVAESTFRRLKGVELLAAVYAGAQYVDEAPRTTRMPQQIAA
jgi:putative transposase